MQIEPVRKFSPCPCSIVAVGTAYEHIRQEPFDMGVPVLKDNGYGGLKEIDTYIKEYLKVKRKHYYKRSERPTLQEFLEGNVEKCVVCVYGHYLYAEEDMYYSFFNNDNDKVVQVWYVE